MKRTLRLGRLTGNAGIKPERAQKIMASGRLTRRDLTSKSVYHLMDGAQTMAARNLTISAMAEQSFSEFLRRALRGHPESNRLKRWMLSDLREQRDRIADARRLGWRLP